MSEVTPHVERCPTCGHVRVNLSGPPPGRTRPAPNDQQQIVALLEKLGKNDDVRFGAGWPVTRIEISFNENGAIVKEPERIEFPIVDLTQDPSDG